MDYLTKAQDILSKSDSLLGLFAVIGIAAILVAVISRLSFKDSQIIGPLSLAQRGLLAVIGLILIAIYFLPKSTFPTADSPIVTYGTVIKTATGGSANVHDFDIRVCQLLHEGWRPAGPVVVLPDKTLLQTMVAPIAREEINNPTKPY